MEITYEALLGRLIDMRALACPAPEGETSGCCSSFDRRSYYDAAADRYVDWDANDDGRGALRTLEDGTLVAAELKGPGVIWRSWSAMPGEGAIRVYVDGECVIDRPFRSYFTGFGQDFAPQNLPSLCPHISRGYNSFLPIPFNRSLRIELAPGWGAYYHFTYTRFAKGTRLPRYDEAFTRAGRVLLAKLDRTLYRRGERLPDAEGRRVALKAGEEACVLEQSGAGALSRMAFRLNAEAMAVSRELLLRIYWDGEAEPSVCAPLCDFFACTPLAGSFRTWVCGKTGDTLYANWYMPFARGARVTLTNRADVSLDVWAAFDVQECPKAQELWRFCARHHPDEADLLSDPAFGPGGERFPDWPVLRVSGRAGRFCGMHLAVTDTFPYPDGLRAEEWWFGFGGESRLDWWWGEGDEKFFVDGEKFPSTFGTGSEDYIGYAWAAEPPFALFDSPFAAMSDMPLDGNGETSVCRFHVCDSVPFTRSFEAYIEKYKQNAWGAGGTCLYKATPYWYEDRSAKEERHAEL